VVDVLLQVSRGLNQQISNSYERLQSGVSEPRLAQGLENAPEEITFDLASEILVLYTTKYYVVFSCVVLYCVVLCCVMFNKAKVTFPLMSPIFFIQTHDFHVSP